uniref:Uncharacterized protein n=1 Tax=Daphnia galeata TaxID=27404 RepID=A0A8J2WM22_9CRUS|nr:unnamed protein product [Daphnia galeata]
MPLFLQPSSRFIIDGRTKNREELWLWMWQQKDDRINGQQISESNDWMWLQLRSLTSNIHVFMSSTGSVAFLFSVCRFGSLLYCRLPQTSQTSISYGST